MYGWRHSHHPPQPETLVEWRGEASPPPPGSLFHQMSFPSVCPLRMWGERCGASVPGKQQAQITSRVGCWGTELTEVWTDIFDISLSQALVPLKTSTIIPAPKSAAAKSRKIRSTSDALSSVIHTALTHLESGDSYISLLFLDFSSAFNTIIPQTLANKLLLQGLTRFSNWILDFLTHRIRIHGISSSPIILNTSSPSGCVLSPLLYTLFTYDGLANHPGSHIVKFSDDTAVVGLISHHDESSYWQEVEDLVDYCGENKLYINVGKTKELVVDFIHGAFVEMVHSFKYLGAHISRDLKWTINTSHILKKAHQRLYFVRKLRQAGLNSSVLAAFYRCVAESTLTLSITSWYGNCSAADRTALQRVVRTRRTQKITRTSFSSIKDIYTSTCTSSAAHIMKDPTHPAHGLFDPLPSGKRLRSIKSRTTRLKRSFFSEAVGLMNSIPH